MAVVGNNFAIMETRHTRLAGFTAWFAWAFIQPLFLPQLQRASRSCWEKGTPEFFSMISSAQPRAGVTSSFGSARRMPMAISTR